MLVAIKSDMDIRKTFNSWNTIHKLDKPIKSITEFNGALNHFHKYDDFNICIYRGEPNIYDSTNTSSDTFLVSKIAREAVEKRTKLNPLTRHINQDFRQLNITREEINEIETCKASQNQIRIEKYSSTWIGYAQHYGYQTRLLDFSSSPLVALFFACWQKDEFTDGVVYMVTPNTLRSQSTNRANVEPGDIEQGIPASYYEIFEGWSLSKIRENIPHKYVPLRPDYIINQRLNTQNGLFVWWHPLEQNIPCQYYPFIVDKDSKREILRNLKLLGFCPQVLFPDEQGMKWQSELDKILK